MNPPGTPAGAAPDPAASADPDGSVGASAPAPSAEREPPAGHAAGPVSPGGPVLPEQSREDTDAAWGDYPEPADDRLYRDRPPHWADY